MLGASLLPERPRRKQRIVGMFYHQAAVEAQSKRYITLFQGASLEKRDCGCFGFNFQPFTTFSDAAHEVSVLSGNESSVSPPMDVFLGAVHVQQVVMNDHWEGWG